MLRRFAWGHDRINATVADLAMAEVAEEGFGGGDEGQEGDQHQTSD
jgi:hypothetical protein